LAGIEGLNLVLGLIHVLTIQCTHNDLIVDVRGVWMIDCCDLLPETIFACPSMEIVAAHIGL